MSTDASVSTDCIITTFCNLFIYYEETFRINRKLLNEQFFIPLKISEYFDSNVLFLCRLQRQNTAYDESCLPPGGWSRRGSQPTALSPDVDDPGRKARRDSLSPDSASRGRR